MIFSTHNYSGYKKIKEDEHTAVMQHNDGHHIVIAKAALKPEHRKALKDLPLHFDGGGEVTSDDAQAPTEQVSAAAAPDTSTPTFASDAAAGALAAGPKGGG